MTIHTIYGKCSESNGVITLERDVPAGGSLTVEVEGR